MVAVFSIRDARAACSACFLERKGERLCGMSLSFRSEL